MPCPGGGRPGGHSQCRGYEGEPTEERNLVRPRRPFATYDNNFEMPEGYVAWEGFSSDGHDGKCACHEAIDCPDESE